MTDLATVLVEAAWDLEGLGLVGLAAAFALVIIGWPVEQAIAWWDARHRAAPRRTPTSRVRPSAAFPRWLCSLVQAVGRSLAEIDE